MARIPVVTQELSDYIWRTVSNKCSKALEESPLHMKKGAKKRKLDEILSIPTIVTGSVWTKTEKARSAINDLMKKVKPCARLREEKSIIQRLTDKIQPLEDSLMIDETTSKVVTALHSLSDNEMLVAKLKDYRTKTLKWGVDNGRESIAESFLHDDIVMIHTRSIIVATDEEYRTDEEIAQEYQECQKKNHPVRTQIG